MNAQSTLKILLVEDNVVNQKVTSYQLKSLGYIADVVSGRQAALEKIAAITYDLVLMNCQIPDGDGYETAQAIRQLETKLNRDRPFPIIIIAMDSELTPESQAQGRVAGIDNYLSKPIRKEELAQELQLWQQKVANNLFTTSESSLSTDSASQDNGRASLNQLIDWEHLRQMSDNNQDFEIELLKIFVEDTQQHLTEAKVAIDSENFSKLEQQAHHMKGASANVGMKSMQMAAAQLEQQARAHQLSGAIELIAEIESPLSAVKAFIMGKP